jgi:hypothetical protein
VGGRLLVDSYLWTNSGGSSIWLQREEDGDVERDGEKDKSGGKRKWWW